MRDGTVTSLCTGDIVRAASSSMCGRYDCEIQRTQDVHVGPLASGELCVLVCVVPDSCFTYHDADSANGDVVLIVLSASGHMHAYVSEQKAIEMLT